MSHSAKLPLAFGTRKLRAEYALRTRGLIGSEGHVKELMRVDDGMGRREKQMNGKARALEGEKETIKLMSQKQKRKRRSFPKSSKSISETNRDGNAHQTIDLPDGQAKQEEPRRGSKNMMSHRTRTMMSRDYSTVK